MTFGQALARLGESVEELARDDARRSRRHRIDAVVLRYASVLEVYGEMVREIRNEVDKARNNERDA